MEYINKSKYYLHFNTLNVFYFGVVVDIIDSLIPKNDNLFLKYGVDMKFIDNLKAFLYKVIIEKADKWGEILSELKFSNLSLENQRKFLYKLYNELYFDNDFKYNKKKISY